jgi:hypothetical protein
MKVTMRIGWLPMLLCAFSFGMLLEAVVIAPWVVSADENRASIINFSCNNNLLHQRRAQGRAERGVAISLNNLAEKYRPQLLANNVLAYAANKKEGQREDLHVVVGNERGRKYDSIALPVFSPSGRSVAYLAGEITKRFVVRDTEPGKLFDELEYGPVWSPEGEQLGYIAKVKQQTLQADELYFVAINGREFGPYKYTLPRIVFSKDGQHFMASVAMEKGKSYVLVDGELKGPHSIAAPLKFVGNPPEGMYLSEDKNEHIVFIGDKQLDVKLPRDSQAFEISDDGKNLVYVRNENGEVWRRVLTLRE